MTVELFSVYDSAARAFMEPFHAPTIESAIRSFRHTVNNGKNQIQQFPEDYTLFHIGTFNQEEGTVSALATPANLGVAITFQDQKPDTYDHVYNASGPRDSSRDRVDNG